MPSSEVGESELIGKSKSELCVLQHVVKAQIFDLIVGGVNVLVAVLHLGLCGHG